MNAGVAGSANDGRASRHANYPVSQVLWTRIEEHFGWGMTVGRICQTVCQEMRCVDQHFAS
jgi:hypothetical protein